MIRLYHSYCKQPKYGDKLNWSTCPDEAKNPTRRSRKEAQLDDHDDDFNNNNNNEEDYLDLSRLVSERLNKLLERSSGRQQEQQKQQQQRDDKSKEATENEDASAAVASHNSPRDELDEIVIDPGYEISLDDINKLPDFSYEE